MSFWCDNPHEHEREGRKDFERRGPYGYNHEKYHDHWDDCAKHYQRGFNEAKQEEDRRQEFTEELRQQQAREDQRLRQIERQRHNDEQAYYEQQQQELEREEKTDAEQKDAP